MGTLYFLTRQGAQVQVLIFEYELKYYRITSRPITARKVVQDIQKELLKEKEGQKREQD